MRVVGSRQFQRFFYKEVKSLPVIITKGAKKLFIVLPFRDNLIVDPEDSDIEMLKTPIDMVTVAPEPVVVKPAFKPQFKMPTVKLPVIDLVPLKNAFRNLFSAES